VSQMPPGGGTPSPPVPPPTGPPPAGPPPGGPPPGGAASGRPAGGRPFEPTDTGFPRRRDRTPLDDVRSPYGLVIAVSVVAIFALPNLLTLLVLALSDGMELTSITEGGADGGALTGALIGTIVLQLGVMALALLPLLGARRPYARLLGPTRWTPAMWGLGLVIGFATTIITYTVNAIVALSIGIDEPVEQELLDIVLAGGTVTLLAVLLAVVIAPVGEEIIFRGVLHRAIADKAGFWVGAIISSALFAVVHVEVVLSQPYGLVGLFLVGFLLALAYHRTGSLIVPIIGHAVFNAVSVSLAIGVDRLGLDAAFAIGLPARLLLG
jgi:uncharacterized protein